MDSEFEGNCWLGVFFQLWYSTVAKQRIDTLCRMQCIKCLDVAVF